MSPPAEPARLVKTYDYTDEHGRLLFQVCRMEPKTFRQRHQADGQWVWGLRDIRRVPYNLPRIIATDEPIWIVEGEKDADTLNGIGLVAMTNAMGAEKWLDAYNEFFRGKNVVLCGDNDEPGRKHVDKLTAALGEIARSVRIVKVPEPHKDVSDLFAADPEARPKLLEAFKVAPVVSGGVVLPILSAAEMEARYREYCQQSLHRSLPLSALLPGLSHLRRLVPGELAVILANTGVGKTFLLQNIAIAARPLPVVIFEMELPETLMFERFAAMASGKTAHEVETAYTTGESVDWRSSEKLDNIHVCSKSKLSPKDIERFIRAAELKTGEKPAVVMVDYLGLIQGMGKRYERISDAAEDLKVIAKETGTIIIATSQIGRKDTEDPEVFIHDGMESGSIENSAGVVLGAWRDPEKNGRIWVKVCKSTKGGAGTRVACLINSSLVVEQENPQPEPKSEGKKEKVPAVFRGLLSGL